MKNLIKLVYSLCLLIFPTCAFADAELPEPLNSFASWLKTAPGPSIQDLTNVLPGLAPPPSADRYPYSAVTAHYKKYVDALKKHYPENTITFTNARTLKPFNGEKTVQYIPSYYLPYMLFNAPLFTPDRLKFEKFEYTYRKQAIYGLRMTTSLNSVFGGKSPQQLIPLLYIETLNARLFGFTHAQLIVELSSNVEPATQFRYNQIQDWSTHERYERFDQISRPIGLTNYAHAIGEHYVISDHPDFALNFLSYNSEPVTLTFFLWKNDFFSSIFSRVASLPPRLPDFIFQLVFEKPV